MSDQWSTSAMHDVFRAIDDIQVINLARRTDRRREMTQQLQLIGATKYNWLNAVRPDDAGSFPTKGARGCFLSHLQALTAARDKQVGTLLVLEDDVDFAADFRDRFQTIFDGLPPDWSILYGAHGGIDQLSSKTTLVPLQAPIVSSSFMIFNGAIIPRLVDYLNAMLERPAGSPDGGPMHVDGAYSWFRRANPDCMTFAAFPALGTQRPSRTDVHELKWFDRIPGAREIASLLRRMRRAAG